MAYRAYICEKCNKEVLFAFENEFQGASCGRCKGDMWRKLPPIPYIIHQTECFMSEPLLDSIHSAAELDRILRVEAGHEREDKLLNDARRKYGE